ncbi:hypothetical protein ACFYO9_24140 [Streptomyces sp. NPDC005863]|uniref:hypothetical protein n=1 Tax=unclassified Streptomyces TaxID=2593676 RepID=UPI003406AA9E
MIVVGEIPKYNGDFAKVETAISELRTHATGVRSGGVDVHSRFQAIGAYYQAPEADQLLSSTQPVMDKADGFAADIETLADALETFVAEAKPYADQLERLRLRAIDFVNSVDGDDDWTQDQDKLDKNQGLIDDVSAARNGFQMAERKAANKINAISPAVCRPVWVEDDGSHGTGMYGESLELLKDAKELPWGTPEERTYEKWSLDWWGHGAKSWAWDGIVKDNIVGSLDGLGTLVGTHGSEARGQAWDGLRRTFVGGYAYGMDLFGQGEHLSDWQRDSKAYAKEFGKQFIAYDMWKEDPARAHATVTFNLLTFGAGPLAGIAKLSKGGKFAKGAAALAKVGDVIDPISGGLKATRALADLPKVSAVLARVSEQLHLPKPKFADSSLDLSDRWTVGKDGRLIPIGPDGTPNLKPAPPEAAAHKRGAGMSPGDRELAGVGGRAPEAGAHAGGHGPGTSGHAGEGLPPRAGHEPGSEAGGGSSDPGVGDHAGDHTAGHGSNSASDHGADHGGGEGGPGGDAMDGAHPPHDPGNGGAGGGDTPGGHDGASPDGEGQPMARGGETEQRLRDAIKGIPGAKRPKPNVMERVLDRLASEPDGQRVAEIISSGHFNQGDEYGQVISAMGAKREQMFQPAADQLIFADDLVRSGVPANAIDFEQKFPVGADMDIRIKDESGDIYAYQMKHLNDPQDPVSEITRGKYLLQLANAEADHSVLLVDGGRGTIAEWVSNGSYDELMAINGGARGRKGTGITFVVRLEDGNLVIPPGSKTDPKDML